MDKIVAKELLKINAVFLRPGEPYHILKLEKSLKMP